MRYLAGDNGPGAYIEINGYLHVAGYFLTGLQNTA